jgi:hypothetical protein
MDSMVTSPTSPPSSTTALPVAPPAAHLSHPPSYDVHLAMHPDAAGQPSIALPARPSLPPPEYSEVPETRAERMFWYGLLMYVRLPRPTRASTDSLGTGRSVGSSAPSTSSALKIPSPPLGPRIPRRSLPGRGAGDADEDGRDQRRRWTSRPRR